MAKRRTARRGDILVYHPVTNGILIKFMISDDTCVSSIAHYYRKLGRHCLLGKVPR